MGIYETYSKRLKNRDRAGQPDVYQYDELPQPLRVQITYIWNSAIGPSVERGKITNSQEIWEFIDNTLSRELGVFYLGGSYNDSSEARCKSFLRNASTDQTLDIIEFSFLCILKMPPRSRATQYADNAIEELNHRFKEHGVGYQFEGGEIVRVDSQYVHAEVVKPAISLLNTAGFDGASEEFLRAHEHYRKGRLREAMSDALKAFESTMKAICGTNGWKYREGDTAKALIKTVLDNGLVPKYMETHLGGLRNTLEAGLPTVRNKNSGHGQGAQVREVPGYFTGYALHLAATNIVFLVEAHEALNSK